MATLDELTARVAESYAGLAMPSWPNPHPGGATARDEEYSRVTEPERYAIVHARARLWTDRLAELPGVEVVPLDGGGARIASARPDTLPLLLVERRTPLPGRSVSLAALHVCVARPELVVEMVPDCGCDACDWGSDDLLQVIDETVGEIVGGPFVVLRADGWHAYWSPEGGSSGGEDRGLDHATAMDLCRRLASGEDVSLPGGTEVLVGQTWLG